MTRFQLSDGQDITGIAFEANGIAYPANWTLLASDDELAAVGVKKITPEPVAVDDTALHATQALQASDIVLLRCFEADISLPTEWKAYRATLRQIIRDGSGTLPDRPKYPAGT